MTSIQRKFAACLITLLMLLPISYTGQATKLTPGNRNEDNNEENNLETTMRSCLNGQAIKFAKLSVTEHQFEVVLNANTAVPVDCKIVNAIRECTLNAVSYEPDYYLTISIAPSAQEAPALVAYKGHTGTGTDPDSMPICVDVLALKSVGTLKINYCKVERNVSKDAKLLGVRIDDLDVKVKKCEEDKLCLQVSGKASASEVDVLRFRRIVTALMKKHTGVQTINTDNLTVRPAKK
jgi:hypothetical protein